MSRELIRKEQEDKCAAKRAGKRGKGGWRMGRRRRRGK
jgi:hypothetical protein